MPADVDAVLAQAETRMGLIPDDAKSGPDPLYGGLSRLGRQLVAALNERRILVDLAHLSRAGFWDAIAAHDPSLPLSPVGFMLSLRTMLDKEKPDLAQAVNVLSRKLEQCREAFGQFHNRGHRAVDGGGVGGRRDCGGC